MKKVRVSSVIDKQYKRVRASGAVLMSDAIGVAIEADRRGFDELADFIAANREQYHQIVVGNYVVTDRVCKCIEEETGANAADYANTHVKPLDDLRQEWMNGPEQDGVPFEEHAATWFAAARHYRETSPNAYRPDPDCPYCGGSGKTDVEECQEILTYDGA